jgi:methylated-DNA-[protein]-cysteine S-methyltransferase
MSLFKKKVIEIVKKIPKGEVLSYGAVADRAGNRKAGRVVGNIMKANHDPLVPCHRVIRSDGIIGGYNGGESEKKKKLMDEGIRVKGNRIIYFSREHNR